MEWAAAPIVHSPNTSVMHCKQCHHYFVFCEHCSPSFQIMIYIMHILVLYADTPQYIYAPSVPYDVRKFYPHPGSLKFIVMLRNPADRALSSYWFKNSKSFNEGHEDKGSMSLQSDEMSIIWLVKLVCYRKYQRFYEKLPYREKETVSVDDIIVCCGEVLCPRTTLLPHGTI